MQAYHILTLSSGQPVILYVDEKKVYLYTIRSGRIRCNGIVFSDVSDSFMLLQGSKSYVSYISDHGQLKFYEFREKRFLELFTYPKDMSKDFEIKQMCPINFNGNVLLFYLIHHFNDSSNSLFFFNASTQRTVFIAKEDYSYEQFQIVALKNEAIIVLEGIEKQQLFLLHTDLSVEKKDIFGCNHKIVELKNTLTTDNQKINFMKNEMKNKDNEIETYKKNEEKNANQIKTLQEKLAESDLRVTSYEETIRNKTKEINALQEKLYKKETEISTLKNTQSHITKQYNELADFAGQLQEELRKVRYL